MKRHLLLLTALFGARTPTEQEPEVATQFADRFVAPPLDGLWASAPYSHNGSAPRCWSI